jgi:hypothetical protein
VVKLVYTQVLGTCAERREGSSPFSRTFSRNDPTLGRAYYLKEGLRVIFKHPLDHAADPVFELS